MRRARRRGRQRARDSRQARGGALGSRRRTAYTWDGSWTGRAGYTGAGSGGCSPATWRRASSGPRRRAPGGARRRNARATGTALAVSFGDAFLLDSFLRSSGLMACADACGHAEPDTARARLAPCVPAGLADRHAGDWWELTYARFPAPGPGWPPRERSASAWNTLMTLT